MNVYAIYDRHDQYCRTLKERTTRQAKKKLHFGEQLVFLYPLGGPKHKEGCIQLKSLRGISTARA